MADAFYEQLHAGRYAATPAAVGPWNPGLSHGGPPAALLAHAIEREFPRDDARVARIAFDFHGSVPVGETQVTAEIIRPGSRDRAVSRPPRGRRPDRDGGELPGAS